MPTSHATHAECEIVFSDKENYVDPKWQLYVNTVVYVAPSCGHRCQCPSSCHRGHCELTCPSVLPAPACVCLMT